MKVNKTLNLRTLRREILNLLQKLDSPVLEADYIMCHYTGMSRARLHGHITDSVEETVVEKIRAAAARRAEHEPLQYILGECDFDGLPVIVTPGCLVPRPETELLVECAAECFDGSVFMDWGTGTGCISLALLKRFPSARALMVEKNPASIDCARRNLEKFGFSDRADIIRSESPEDIPDCRCSLLVSNPPYIPSRVVDDLMPEVSSYEPRLALDGGEDGLAPYRKLFVLAERVLFPGGYFCVEYGGDDQTETLRGLASPKFRETGLFRDIADRDRVLCWQFGTSL